MIRKNKKVVVTGGAGFIGSNLTAELTLRGYKVCVIDDLSTGKRNLIPKKVAFYKTDIRDFSSLLKVFKKIKPDEVYHLAAHSRVRTSIDDPLDSLSRNVVGTGNVLEASRQTGVKRVVFTSSSAVYGSPKESPFREEMKIMPESPYGAHKYAGEGLCELYTKLYKLPTVVLRLFNAYGPNQPSLGPSAVVIPIFLGLRKKWKPIEILGSGEQSRDFVHTKDICSALVKAMENPKLGKAEVINVGSGKAVSIKKIAELIGGKIIYKKAAVEQLHTWANINKAKRLLNWKPSVSLEAEIKKYKKEWGIS